MDPLACFQHLIIFSPHYDDAFLSLGGYLGYCHPSKQITVVVVFGRSNHVWGQDVGNELVAYASAVRAHEEATNVQRINASLIVCDHAEALVRGYRRRDGDAGRYPIQVDDALDEACRQAVDADVATIVHRHPAALHLFPLAIGRHVDHALVRGVADCNQLAGSHIAYYEDLPYACREPATGDRVSQMNCILLPVDPAAKVKFIRTYASQGAQKWADEVLRYMSSLRGEPGHSAERLWLPNDATH